MARVEAIGRSYIFVETGNMFEIDGGIHPVDFDP